MPRRATAIECSLIGCFQLVLHKRAQTAGTFLAELGPQAQTQVYQKSSLDLAMRDAFRKARRYLMQAHGLDEDEALPLMSVAVDFGVTRWPMATGACMR